MVLKEGFVIVVASRKAFPATLSLQKMQLYSKNVTKEYFVMNVFIIHTLSIQNLFWFVDHE